MNFIPTIEHVKQEVESYDLAHGKIIITDEQANCILDKFNASLQSYFCDFINSYVIDGDLEDLLEAEDLK